MPEGVEVKIVGERLSEWLQGNEILSIEVSEVWSRRRQVDLSGINFPVRVSEVSTKGKYIMIQLESGEQLISHLGMSGQWYKVAKDDVYQHLQTHLHLHLHVTTMRNQSTRNETIVYYDPRRFGNFGLNLQLPPLGLDIVSREFAWKQFIEQITKFKQKRSKQSICDLLLDQSFLAGVGNYIRADALYWAKLDPFKSYQELTLEEWKRLFKSIQKVVRESYRAQGTTIASYTGGNYETKVYGRSQAPDGREVIAKKHKGRTMYYCV
jgi:DNA-formamidopyrimidine glycosylase